MLTDTHAHLDFPDFEPDRAEVIKRAQEAGVKYIINIGTDIKSSRRVIELAESYPNLFAVIGVHPHETKNIKDTDWKELEKLVTHPKVVGIGEIGLDFYKDYSPAAVQKEALIKQLRLAKTFQKPIVIHSREAHEDTLEILHAEMGDKIRGVAHCFSGATQVAQAYLKLGFYLSFAGPVTFPNAVNLRAVVKTIPVERLLLETDCPFLAPQPHRGKRNEPSYLVYCVEEFSRIYGLTREDIARITSLNTFHLFGVGEMPEKNIIAYPIRNSLYLNITNQCTSDCVFCIRKFSDYVKGHHLRLAKEPTREEIIKAIPSDIKAKYKEVVFCGYGEPTLRLDIIKEVARYLKDKNMPVRIDTNGHGNLIHHRSILPDLAGLIDALSISLNTSDGAQYQRICRPEFGPATFDKVIEFIKEAKQYIPRVEITAVAYPEIDLDKCQQLARDLGVDFRVRGYNEVG